MSLKTNLEDNSETILRLFVYGTRSIQPAVAWDRLYHLHAGFPPFDVPEGLTLARSTADPPADARRQQEICTPPFGRPTGDWDLVHGELMTFANPGFDLPSIDRREAFDPNGRNMYQRVLVVAECQDRPFSCWTDHGLSHIPRGSVRFFQQALERHEIWLNSVKSGKKA